MPPLIKNIEKHFKIIAKNALKIHTLKIPQKVIENGPKTIDFRARRTRDAPQDPKNDGKNNDF